MLQCVLCMLVVPIKDLKWNSIGGKTPICKGASVENFENEAYSELVADLLNDAIYLQDRSKRGIISTVRQYAEVVVRRILDLAADTQVTLGKAEITSGLKAKSNNSKLLMDAIENIRLIGNKCTHTKELGPITEDDIANVFDSLFDVYAFLFVDFFTEHKFGRNGAILSSFSILPPIIRYKALKNLYEADRNNISVIDKYSLSILKAIGVSEAKAWVLERKEELVRVPAYTKEGIEEIKKNHGQAYADKVMLNAPNMFECSMQRICEVAGTIAKNGALYKDFESAMDLFKAKGFVEGSTVDIVLFNEIMQFVYLGRKPSPNDRLDKSYITIR